MALQSLGALIDSSWEQYRKEFPTLIRLSAWLLVVAAINIVAIGFYPVDAYRVVRPLTGLEMFGLALFVFNNVVIGIIMVVWTTNMLIAGVDKMTGGAAANMKEIANRGWNTFIPQLVAFVYTWVAITISVLIPLLLIKLFTETLAPSLPVLMSLTILLILMLLLIPSIAVVFMLAFVPFAVVVDDKRGFDALKTSWLAVKANFWQVFIRLAVPKILYFGILFLAQYFIINVVQLVLLGTTDEGSGTYTRLSTYFQAASYLALVVFVNPLSIITDYHIWKSIKQ